MVGMLLDLSLRIKMVGILSMFSNVMIVNFKLLSSRN